MVRRRNTSTNAPLNTPTCRGTSLTKKRPPPKSPLGPYAYAYGRPLGGGGSSYEQGTPAQKSLRCEVWRRFEEAGTAHSFCITQLYA